MNQGKLYTIKQPGSESIQLLLTMMFTVATLGLGRCITLLPRSDVIAVLGVSAILRHDNVGYREKIAVLSSVVDLS